MYRVFIKYFLKILRYILDSGLSRFPIDVSVYVHNGRSNTSAAAELAEFRKNHNILRKNTIFNEHPVDDSNKTLLTIKVKIPDTQSRKI